MHRIFRNFTLNSFILLALTGVVGIAASACGSTSAAVKSGETESSNKAAVTPPNENIETESRQSDSQSEPQLKGVYKKEKSANSEKAARELNPVQTAEVSFTNLAVFIDDAKRHKTGVRFIIRNVPAAKIENVSDAVEATGNPAHQGLFALDFNEGDDSGSGSGTFLTSKTLIRNLQSRGNSEAAKLRITAVLVETAGDVNIYRSVFVTKIEGLNEKRESIWTATGAPPAKLRFGF